MRCHPFDLLLEMEPEYIRLDCAALHLARDVYPQLHLDAYLSRLDEMAEAVAAKRPGLSATLRYEALRDVLVGEYRLTGNQKNYHDPQNSYLNRVLDRRRGIPITLAVVWIEVGRRLKWPVSGVAFPGHFLVRIDDPERFVICDAFHAGRSMSYDDCREMLEKQLDGKVEFSQTYLAPVDTRSILARMLNNLHRIYLGRNDLPRLANVLRRLIAVEPEQGRHLQDLAAVSYRLGDIRAAYGYLSLYLERSPSADDRDVVRRSLDRLRAAITAQN